jgi:thiol-disulfide isomerase/thioredoxin
MRKPSRLACIVASALLFSACRQTPAPAPVAPAAPPPAASAAATQGTEEAATAPETVKEFPALEVETFTGGHWSLAQHRGKWVVVNFWATWCNPCLKEIPELDAFDKARDQVEVIGLAYEEIERPDMEAFLKEHPFGYPVALMDVYRGLPDFPIPKGLPMTYLIAPDGKVAKQFLGPVAMKELESFVDAPGAAAARK